MNARLPTSPDLEARAKLRQHIEEFMAFDAWEKAETVLHMVRDRLRELPMVHGGDVQLCDQFEALDRVILDVERRPEPYRADPVLERE